jgi:hypothetical protein
MGYDIEYLNEFFSTMYDALPQIEITAYKRGNDQISFIDALISRSSFETRDDYGSFVTSDSTDFIVKTSALAGLFPPQRGDVIVVGTDAHEIIEPQFKYCDVYKRLVRIHTKRTSGVDISGGVEVVESADKATNTKWVGTTTDATYTEIFTGDDYTERFTIEIGRAYIFDLLAIAMDVENIVTKSWNIKGTVKRDNSGVVHLVTESVEDTIATDPSAEDWDVDMVAGTATNSLEVWVIGTLDANIKWSVSGRMNELRSN